MIWLWKKHQKPGNFASTVEESEWIWNMEQVHPHWAAPSEGFYWLAEIGHMTIPYVQLLLYGFNPTSTMNLGTQPFNENRQPPTEVYSHSAFSSNCTMSVLVQENGISKSSQRRRAKISFLGAPAKSNQQANDSNDFCISKGEAEHTCMQERSVYGLKICASLRRSDLLLLRFLLFLLLPLLPFNPVSLGHPSGAQLKGFPRTSNCTWHPQWGLYIAKNIVWRNLAHSLALGHKQNLGKHSMCVEFCTYDKCGWRAG